MSSHPTEHLATTGWSNRARIRLRSLVVRPWRSQMPSQPLLAGLTMLLGLIAFATLLVVVGVGTTPIPWGEVLLMAALVSIASAMTIDFGVSYSYSCSDTFLIVTCMLLDPSAAALVMIAYATMEFVFATSSWHRAIITAAWACVVGASGIGAAAVLTNWFDVTDTWTVPIVAAGIYLALNVLVELLHAGTMLLRPKSSHDAVTEPPSLRGMFVESAHFAGVQMAFVVPMATVGVVVWQSTPWVFALLLTPFVAMWYTTHQAAALEDARKRMHLDGLTGLANRAGFIERAEQEIAISLIERAPAALIMGDLDNFKRVNDNLGHLIGDDVLRTAAAAFHQSREDGVQLVGRYGGEEFVALITGYECERAVEIAEGIRAGIEESLDKWGTTISLGVAYLEWGDRLESLIDRADVSLYAAKHAGKNRVFHRAPDADGPCEAERTPEIEIQMARRAPRNAA